MAGNVCVFFTGFFLWCQQLIWKKTFVANEVWCSKSVFCNFFEGLCNFRLALRLVCITWTLDKQKNTTAQNIILQPTFTHIEEKKVFKSSECLMQGHYTIPLCLKNTIIHFICRVSQYWYTPTPWLTLLLVLGKSRVNKKSR